MPETVGVLLMAYGSPNSLDEVEPYYRSIRGGRAPTPEAVEHLTDRYRRVGGRTPLLEVTRNVGAALERRLNGEGGSSYRVYEGMKHWHPFIAESIARIAGDGVRRLVAFPMAPHFSEMSIGGYRSAVEEAVRSQALPMSVSFIESWHANPLFVEAVAEKIRGALEAFPAQDRSEVEVVFSAHSLPTRIQEWSDPYPAELRQSCEAVASAAGLASWRFAFQSAGRTGEPWLGPDILETLAHGDLRTKEGVLVVPIGFVCDNLEILFDIDVEAQELATQLGLNLRRTEMLNTSPLFIEALADLVLNGTGARVAELA